MVKDHSDSHIGYSFWLAARVLLYAPSHRQDSTYHGLCYTSRGALAGTRNSSMGPPYEGSIRRPIAPLLPRSYVSLLIGLDTVPWYEPSTSHVDGRWLSHWVTKTGGKLLSLFFYIYFHTYILQGSSIMSGVYIFFYTLWQVTGIKYVSKSKYLFFFFFSEKDHRSKRIKKKRNQQKGKLFQVIDSDITNPSWWVQPPIVLTALNC